MGKKSSQKKQRRALMDGGETTANSSASSSGRDSKVGSSKIVKVSPGTEAEKVSGGPFLPSISFSGQKIVATLLVLVALVLLAFGGIFILAEITKPKSISHFLPIDTISFAEVSSDLNSTQWQNYYNLVDGTDFPSVATLVKNLNTTFNVDLTKDIYPWLSRQVGAAMLQDRRSVLFLEVKDEKKALDFFRSHRLEGITEDLKEKEVDGVTVYQYIATSPMTILFLGNYAVVASDETAARSVIAATKGDSLYEENVFQRVNNGVPRSHLGFIYGHPSQLLALAEGSGASAEQSPVLLGDEEKGISDRVPDALQSVIVENFISEGMSLSVLEGMMSIEHFALLNTAARKEGQYIKAPEKYRANLASVFSDKTQLFAGGMNAGYVVEKLQTMLASKNLTPAIIEEYLRAQVAQIFNEKITYENILDLLAREYAVGIDNGEFKLAIELSGDMNEQQEQQKTIQKMIEGYRSLHSTASPTADSSTNSATDSLANPSRSSPPRSPLDPRLTIVRPSSEAQNPVAVITLTEASADQVAALWNRTQPTFQDTPSYESFVLPQLQSGDDIIYAQPKMLAANPETLLPPWLQFMASVAQISISSNSFEDGMKTIILFSPR